MKENQIKKPVLVTGGSGYIASWIVKYLLDDGKHVRITVRDKRDSSKYQHLLTLAEASPGQLEVYEADLLKEGSFKEAIAGCEVVYHTASPFKVTGIRDAMRDLIYPAVNGTSNVLNEATRSGSVKKVVLTSSVAAIYGDAMEASRAPGGQLTEEVWNTSSSASHQPYSYSKTAAERKAWEIARAQDVWQLVTINPGFVLGPSLTPRTDSTSISIMRDIISGKYRMGVPNLHFAVVDVRDVARAHILAAENHDATGRFIIASQDLSMVDIARLLHEMYGKSLPLPKGALPVFLLYLAGPLMGFSWKFIRLNMGHSMPFSNERSRQKLGMTYTDISTTLEDHTEQLIRDKLIKAARKG